MGEHSEMALLSPTYVDFNVIDRIINVRCVAVDLGHCHVMKTLDLYALLMGDVAEYVCVWVTQIKAALFLVVVKGV